MENVMFEWRDHFASSAEQSSHAHGRFGLAYLRSYDPLYPCTIVADKYRRECYMMQSSAILMFNNFDFINAFSICDSAPEEFIKYCYRSMGRDINSHTERNPERSSMLCQLGNSSYAEHCFVGVAENFTNLNGDAEPAIAFCAMIPETVKSACFTAVGEQVAALLSDDAAREGACAHVEEPYVEACRVGARLATPR
jgi:hypothetical protein